MLEDQFIGVSIDGAPPHFVLPVRKYLCGTFPVVGLDVEILLE